jgi:hypothetical protein
LWLKSHLLPADFAASRRKHPAGAPTAIGGLSVSPAEANDKTKPILSASSQ